MGITAKGAFVLGQALEMCRSGADIDADSILEERAPEVRALLVDKMDEIGIDYDPENIEAAVESVAVELELLPEEDREVAILDDFEDEGDDILETQEKEEVEK
jgi:hypothetical protein